MTTTTNKTATKSAPSASKPADKPAETTATGTGNTGPAAPVKATRTRKPPAPVDFGALTIEDAEAPVRSGPGGSTWVPNDSLLNALRKSWEGRSVSREYRTNGVVTKTTYTGTGKAITVPNADQAKTLVNAIRKHADFLGYGVSVREEKTDKGVKVSFAAKTPKEAKK